VNLYFFNKSLFLLLKNIIKNMKAYTLLHTIGGGGVSIQIILVEIETPHLIPVSPPVINHKYAIYTSPLFTVKKITILNGKDGNVQISEINGLYNVNGDLFTRHNLHVKIGDSVVDAPIQIFKSIDAIKKRYKFNDNTSKEYFCQKEYYDNGAVEKSFFLKGGKLIKTIYRIGNTRVKQIHKRNVTKYLDSKKEVVSTFPFIINHYRENNTDLSQIRSIEYSISNLFRVFRKIFTTNKEVSSKRYYNNLKIHGVSVSNSTSVTIWRFGVIVSHSITDILKEIEYIVPKKNKMIIK
jgi:hypothetical protein